MKIILFSKLDYNFSAQLAKICDLESDELFFLNNFKLLNNNYKNNSLIIVDLDDDYESLEDVVKNVRLFSKCPLYGLMNKMDIKIQKNATSIGFDMVMTKSMFVYNIKTIRIQIKNAFRES